VAATHRAYRRDLVPVRQALTRYDDAASVLRRLSDRQ
jgi:hypothetical protein